MSRRTDNAFQLENDNLEPRVEFLPICCMQPSLVDGQTACFRHQLHFHYLAYQPIMMILPYPHFVSAIYYESGVMSKAKFEVESSEKYFA